MTFYTEEEYAKAYTELLEVLKHISKKSVDKIPKENMDYYLSKCDKNYEFHYNNSVNFKDQNISHLTRILIANIYSDYLMDNKQKEELQENNKKELQQIEEEKREKYNPDDLFKNRNKTINNNSENNEFENNELENNNCINNNIDNINEQMDMIIVKKEGFFKKFLNNIKRLFHLT